MADKLWKATLPPPGKSASSEGGPFLSFYGDDEPTGQRQVPWPLPHSHLGARPLGSDLLGLWALLEGSILPARASELSLC